jgi:hypothetical protein
MIQSVAPWPISIEEFPPGAATAAALILAALGTGALARQRQNVAGTTLVAPWWWTLASLWSIALAGGAMPWMAASSAAPLAEGLYYAAAVTSFCPVVAALGAKRPQDRAWQFVVLSLWIVLILPAAEAAIMRPGQMFEIQGARAWFLLVLIAVGAANSLPTRFWLSSLLFAAGQCVLLAKYLPLGIAGPAEWSPLVGLGLGVAALAVASLGLSRREVRAPLDRVWLDFRDTFGALWSLRVAHRMNNAASLYDWKIGLSWWGFHAADGSPAPSELPHELARDVRQNLDNLLRRFVSAEWIAARLDGGGKCP